MKKQIKYFLIALLFFILAGAGVVNAAEFNATDDNIAETDSEELIYVIGSHLFSEETPYISTQIMMYAARTIDVPEGVEGEEALEYMKVYCRDLEGNWIDAITGENVDLSGVTFNIKYKDLERYIVTTADVKNVAELEEALADPDITTINLVKGDKFETDHSIIVSKPVTLNGNGQEITFTGESGTWREDTQNYVIKVYNTEATIKDLGLTGANAGLQINASKVTLEGTIDVSGNAFGGIEVCKGVVAGLENPQLTIAEGATIENEDETVTTPTIWEDGVNDCIIGGNLVKVTGVKVGQVFYFNEMPEISVSNVEELEHALQTNIEVINITEDFTTDHVIVVGRKVTINGNGKTITYNGETGSWSGGSGDNYVMQVYNTEATIKDIGLTGTSAGLLVNASQVTLEGTINVSGNVVGGIEVSKGTGEGLGDPHLTVAENATIVNTNESLSNPTIWEDGVDNCVTTNLIKMENAKEGADQNFYFNVLPIADVNNAEDFEEAIKDENIEVINLTQDVTVENAITLDKKVTINGNGATLAKGLNITGNDVTIKDVVINDKVTVSGKNAVLDELEITNFATGSTVSKPSGVAVIKVDTEGEFTLTNSKISNVTGTAYNLIDIATPSAVIIENNVFGEDDKDLAGIYNLIEFGQGENEEVKDGTIIRNNEFNTKSRNNTISMFKIEDGATITIENNTFAFSNNAMRLSNYNNASATFNIYNNTILSGTTDNFGGFICFQAVGETAPAHADTYFANYTINVKNLIGTDGQKINTIEGEGTGANRLGYYYADYTADNSMPDSAKAKVNFIEE